MRIPPAPLLAGGQFATLTKIRQNISKNTLGVIGKACLIITVSIQTTLKNQKGYEYYGKFAESMKKTGINGAVEFFMGLQTWGTPEECYHKIEKNCARIGAEAIEYSVSLACRLK